MSATRQRLAALSQHRLTLGLFGANCSNGRTYADLPNLWDGSWNKNAQLAQLAEEVGFDCMIPLARWKGYGGATNPNGASFESFVWAAGLLAQTKRLHVFATVHVPLFNPLIAAKQMASADQIGHGRLGVNVVCGWNDDEFGMFGVAKKAHDDRYVEGEEWWEIVTRIWGGEPPFDYDGTYFNLRQVQGRPGPYGDERPLMMNAGSSETGRAFAAKYSDMHFDGVDTPETAAPRVAATKERARALGREIQVWTAVGVVLRPTQREAEDYVQYCAEHADLGALGYIVEMHNRDESQSQRVAEPGTRIHGEGPLGRRALARGAYCVIGDPDSVAAEFIRLSEAGLDGLALNFVDYLAELPYFAQEVLPRLERAGLRNPVSAAVPA